MRNGSPNEARNGNSADLCEDFTMDKKTAGICLLIALVASAGMIAANNKVPAVRKALGGAA